MLGWRPTGCPGKLVEMGQAGSRDPFGVTQQRVDGFRAVELG